MRAIVVTVLLALVGVLLPIEGAVAGIASPSHSHSKGSGRSDSSKEEPKKEAPRKGEKARSFPVRQCAAVKRTWVRLSVLPGRRTPGAATTCSRDRVDHLHTSLRPAVLQVFLH